MVIKACLSIAKNCWFLAAIANGRTIEDPTNARTNNWHASIWSAARSRPSLFMCQRCQCRRRRARMTCTSLRNICSITQLQRWTSTSMWLEVMTEILTCMIFLVLGTDSYQTVIDTNSANMFIEERHIKAWPQFPRLLQFNPLTNHFVNLIPQLQTMIPVPILYGHTYEFKKIVEK